MANDEFAFANNARASVENTVSRSASLLLFCIGAMLAAAIAWAAWAKVEMRTTGLGRVIPAQQLQTVESLEPGIVAEILAAAGDEVKAGQPIVRIDDTATAASLGELRQRQLAFLAELDRLEKQAAGATTYEVPPGADEAAIPFFRDQIAVFESSRKKYLEQIQVREQQVRQRRQNLLEARANAEKQQATLNFVERELELTRALYRRKAVPEIELLRIERAAAEIQGNLRVWEASQLRFAAEISEAETLLEAENSAFLAEVQARISQVKAELSVTAESLRAAEDRVRRAILRSPVDGTLNTLSISTIGQVVQAGVPVAEIVPKDDRLVVETRIRPQDIATIRPGLPAIIRLDAYDYTRYGTLSGYVERIGADTVTDENRETYYQVIIARNGVEDRLPGLAGREPIRFIPGLTAVVEITSGERTVLEYLLKPVLEIRDQSMREAK